MIKKLPTPEWLLKSGRPVEIGSEDGSYDQLVFTGEKCRATMVAGPWLQSLCANSMDPVSFHGNADSQDQTGGAQAPEQGTRH